MMDDDSNNEDLLFYMMLIQNKKCWNVSEKPEKFYAFDCIILHPSS